MKIYYPNYNALFSFSVCLRKILTTLAHDTNISIMPAISNLMQYKNSMCYIIVTSLLELFRLQDVYYYCTLL